MVVLKQTEQARILVLEDDGDLREYLREFLSDEGYRVDTPVNSEAAVRELETGPTPALIILDVSHPATSGSQLLEKIREQVGSKLKVAALTASAKSNPPGVVATLQKPFSLQELMNLVAKYAG